ncbi:hypothetical protein IAT38_008033 [Cryptococcus sp. DSM 104549]
MPSQAQLALQPHKHVADSTRSIRNAYIHHLTDLLHACLLRGDIPRARRAWAILIRCREVDWKSRWYWGLLFLSTAGVEDEPEESLATMQASQPDGEARQVERWLGTLRVSARPEDQPSILHALVLHLIKQARYRQALDELETYLYSYPYLLSAPLHTYAGLLAFYLAQPLAAQTPLHERNARHASSVSALAAGSEDDARLASDLGPANPAMLRQARGWFAKALEIDKEDEVSKEFIRLIDNPNADEESDDDSVGAPEHPSDEEPEDEEMEEGQGGDRSQWFDFSDEYESA